MKQGCFYLFESNKCVWRNVRVASNFAERLLGLLPVHGLDRQQAIWLPGCRTIHTWRMRFAIDVVGLNRDGEIVTVQRNVQPNTVVNLHGARSIIECEAGCPHPLEQWRSFRLQFYQTQH